MLVPVLLVLNHTLFLFQLKQKTTELTRACQKQYELEQELAFHKIDAKFEPLPFYPNHVSFIKPYFINVTIIIIILNSEYACPFARCPLLSSSHLATLAMCLFSKITKFTQYLMPTYHWWQNVS